MRPGQPSKTRAIGCKIMGDLQGTKADKILAKAERAGIITEYYVGRYLTWFNGPPGEPFRELRQQLRQIAAGVNHE